MNKQEIEKALSYWNEFKAEIKDLRKQNSKVDWDEQEKAVDLAISALEQQLNNGWIPVSSGRLPEEKISPITHDYYKYECTFNSGRVIEVRHYKFGDGHWWHGGGCVDEYITAWRERLEPYKELATDNNVVTKSGKDNNALTIGDKIRESNENLAEFIKTATDKCIIGNCRTCPIYKACDQMENKEDLARYFSQPYTES